MTLFFRGTVAVVIFCCALSTVVPGAVCAAGAVPPRALDEVLTLPPEDDPHGHTPPALALRADGGLVAVWVDIETDQVIGRWYGPSPAVGLSESGFFELSEPNASRGRVEVARDGEGRFLAVWRRGTTPLEPRPLSARPFDVHGVALGDPQPVTEEPVGSFAVVGLPDGGYVLAWSSSGAGHAAVRFRMLGPDGRPAPEGEEPTTVHEVRSEALGPVRLAAEPPSGREGGFLVSWKVVDRSTGRSEVAARGYTTEGRPVGEVTEWIPPAEDLRGLAHGMANTGPGRYLLAWTPTEGSPHPSGSVLTRAFDATGEALGPVHRVDGGEDTVLFRNSLTAAGGAGAGVVAWIDQTEDSGERIVGRLVDPGGSPRGEPFEILAPDQIPGDGHGGVGALRSVRDGLGRMLFGWGVSIDPGVLPSDEHLNWSSEARRYWEVDRTCDPVLAAGLRTEPERPTAGEPVRLIFEGLADCAEVSVDDWSRTADGVHVEALHEGGACGTVPPFPYSVPVEAGAFDAGSYEAVLELGSSAGATCERRFGFEVLEGEGVDGMDPPPPDAPPLTSPALPDFRVWVVITPPFGPVILGDEAPECIPETLCVSGALPDRAEVFVRIVGPKPNGFLWPTLVKFSTSTIEVWIEQISTGERRYYRLEGANPGSSELPGLFDRTGFEP